jgi:UDP-4-amino-4,6-dideoxy-N-acetyl-beta-L-altrosamine transaminase
MDIRKSFNCLVKKELKKVTKHKSIIPYGRQKIFNKDIEAVKRVLKSEYLTQGPEVPEFEKSFKKFCGSKNAIAFNSATSALHAACLSLKVGPGDLIWTSAITFVASANCAIYCGAEIDFVDIDSTTNNMSTYSLEKKLIEAKKRSQLPKVLIPVHLSGLSCDMKKIHKLSIKYNFKIIEDASHSIGAKYNGSYVGSCKYSDITVFSLHPVKIITSGEGGIAVTNNSKLADSMKLVRAHGITKEKSKMVFKKSSEPWYYEQISLGYNYRMSDIHAALGNSQLRSVKSFIKKRKTIAKKYNLLLKKLPLSIIGKKNLLDSSNHLYIIRLIKKNIKNSHKYIFNYLRKNNILVNLHYIPVYLHPFYRKKGFKKGYCHEAERYYGDAISIPIFPSMTNKEQDKVISCLIKCI